jgi:3-hydroxyisobutyrate dehydrogenase
MVRGETECSFGGTFRTVIDPANKSLPVIGLIGLGNLGNPMALSALAAGYKMVVHSLSKSEGTNLIERGAKWADSVADVGAQSDVVITVLPAPKHVREIMIGESGALAQMKPGSTFIDMSTSSVDVANEIRALAEPRGISVMDAPVSFLAKAPIGESRIGASLQIFVGGTAEDFEKRLPLFQALGGMPGQIYHAGPNGAGYGIKVLLNLLWFVHAAGTSEVLAMASKLGLDFRMVQQALSSSPSQSNFLQYDINSVFEAGNYDDGFTIDLVCKDLQLALDLGEKTGIDIPVAKLVEQLHQQALNHFGAKSGEMSVVKLYEDAAGGPFRV